MSDPRTDTERASGQHRRPLGPDAQAHTGAEPRDKQGTSISQSRTTQTCQIGLAPIRLGNQGARLFRLPRLAPVLHRLVLSCPSAATAALASSDKLCSLLHCAPLPLLTTRCMRMCRLARCHHHQRPLLPGLSVKTQRHLPWPCPGQVQVHRRKYGKDLAKLGAVPQPAPAVG